MSFLSKEKSLVFKHSPLQWPEVKVEETDEARIYVVGDRCYPSVTTVLDWHDDKAYLEEWKKRIGEAEANRLSAMAASRGTEIHSMVEDYLNNKLDMKGRMPNVKFMWKPLQPFLNKIEEVYGLEVPVYSDKLKAAGRIDVCAKYKGQKSIIDIKNSMRAKKAEWITDYFHQVTAYSMMVEEMFGDDVTQNVVLITNQEGECQEFIIDNRVFRDDVERMFKEYRDAHQ